MLSWFIVLLSFSSSVTTKDINVKAFNTITNRMKLKQIQNIFHVIVNESSIIQ